MKDIKVSVVMPVYNVQEYLSQCLDSIINQTYKNIEVICINDGSTDNSIYVLKEYAKLDDRIKIFSQENQGQGISRNKGIKYAKGEYILFVDPDDWIEITAIEKIIMAFKKTNAKVLQFDFLTYLEESNTYCQGTSLASLQKEHNIDLKKTNYYTWKNVKKNCLYGLGISCWQRAY